MQLIRTGPIRFAAHEVSCIYAAHLKITIQFHLIHMSLLEAGVVCTCSVYAECHGDVRYPAYA